MASFSLSTVSTATAATTNIKTKTNFCRFTTHTKQTSRFNGSCKETPYDNNIDKTVEPSPHMENIDRRKIILGLGGVFVSGYLTSLSFATATSEPMANSEEGIDSNKLRYKEKRSKIPMGTKGLKFEDKSIRVVKKVEDMEFPVKLDETLKVFVKRPAVNRTKKDKEKANEILLVNGVRFDGEKFVKFDVFVNDIDNGTETTPADSEFAGSFAQLPHGKTNKMMMTSGVRLGLTELLEDIKAEDDEYVLVTLVPRSGCDDVTVSQIKIELVPIV